MQTIRLVGFTFLQCFVLVSSFQGTQYLAGSLDFHVGSGSVNGCLLIFFARISAILLDLLQESLGTHLNIVL